MSSFSLPCGQTFPSFCLTASPAVLQPLECCLQRRQRPLSAAGGKHGTPISSAQKPGEDLSLARAIAHHSANKAAAPSILQSWHCIQEALRDCPADAASAFKTHMCQNHRMGFSHSSHTHTHARTVELFIVSPVRDAISCNRENKWRLAERFVEHLLTTSMKDFCFPAARRFHCNGHDIILEQRGEEIIPKNKKNYWWKDYINTVMTWRWSLG